MGRAKHCAICTSDPAISTALNAQLAAGARQRIVHGQFPEFSISQISRHWIRCLAPKPAAFTAEQGSTEIAAWLRRAEETFLVASANGDVKSAASAISTAVRTLGAMHKKQAQEAEAAKASVDDRFSIAAMDARVHDFMTKRDADRGYPMVKVQCLLEENPEFSQIIFAVWSNRDLLPMLLATATTNYLPERKTDAQPTSH